jgi:hypothetical protein
MKGSKGDPKRSIGKTETRPEQDNKRLSAGTSEGPDEAHVIGKMHTSPEQDTKRFTAGTSGKPDEAHPVWNSCNPHDDPTECLKKPRTGLDGGCVTSSEASGTPPSSSQRLQCFSRAHVPGTVNSARPGKGGRRFACADDCVGATMQIINSGGIHDDGAETTAGTQDPGSGKIPGCAAPGSDNLSESQSVGSRTTGHTEDDARAVLQDPGNRSVNVGDSVTTCGPGENNAPAKSISDSVCGKVGCNERGPVRPEMCYEVFLLEGRNSAAVCVLQDGSRSHEQGKEGPHITLNPKRSSDVLVGPRGEEQRHRDVDGACSDGRPSFGDTTLCRTEQKPAGEPGANKNVEVAVGERLLMAVYDPGEQPAEEELPEVKSSLYYPFGVEVVWNGAPIRSTGRRATRAPLDEISPRRINFAALLALPYGDKTRLSEWLAWIRSDKLLYMAKPRRTERVSHHLRDDGPALTRAGVIAAQPLSDVAFVFPVFKVPKKNGLGRLIVDCRELNEQLPRPGDMALPDIHEVLDGMANAEWIAQADGQSFFYQFELTESIRGLFGMRLGGRRGAFTQAVLKVLPMGFSYAPGIAQATALYVLENVKKVVPTVACTAWVDNFLFWGSKKDVSRAIEEFHRICEIISLTLKETEQGTKLEVLGVTVNCEDHTLSLQPDIVPMEETCSPRQVLSVIGKALWAHYAVVRSPLCEHEDLLRALRQVMETGYRSWDEPVKWPPLLQQAVETFATTARRAGRRVEHNNRKPMAVWSDASGWGLGWVIGARGCQWIGNLPLQGEDIFIKELMAAAAGACAAAAMGRQPLVFVDNTAAVRALMKGHSSSTQANKVLRWAIPQLRNAAPMVAWVPSQWQLADGASRNVCTSSPSWESRCLQSRRPRWA